MSGIMFNFNSLRFTIPNLLWPSSSPSTNPSQHLSLPPLTTPSIEESPEKRARTLKHLIRANHINHSVIYNHLRFHNHAPHILGSAFLLGADVGALQEIYERESEGLEPWVDAPGEISKEDWREFLGKREYQRAWVDFFEDQLVQLGYDWRELLFEYLFQGRNPLANNLISGLGHPLIHLGYAFELHSPTLAIEALALVASFYDNQHVYLDDPKYTTPSPWTETSTLAILQKLHKDPRFAALPNLSSLPPGSETYATISNDKATEALMLEYWNALTITDLTTQFREAQKTAIALLVASRKDFGEKFDFFLCHILTTSHAVRVILPLVPKKWHVPLFRQWWLFVVGAYIAQQRPAIDVSRIEKVDVKGKGWKSVEGEAVKGDWRLDAHFVKAVRTMKVVGETWEGEEEEFCLKAAVGFVGGFEGWGGFGSAEEEGG